MWIVRLALNRPYTFIVLSLLLLLITPLVLLRTPTDIFPNINIPVISVVWSYNGLAPQEMNDRVVSVYERSITTTVNDIEHIESQALNGVSVTKIFFHPGVNIATANAQVTAVSQTQLKQLPPGITPPLILNYNASTVPILQLGLSGQGLSEQQLNDFGANFIRTQLATVQGASIPWPYGGKARQVMVDLDSQKLMARGLSPLEVVNAINAQNVILPSGSAKIGDTEYNIVLNGSPRTVEEINDMPVKVVNGTVIYVRDVAHVRDGFAVQQNIVRQDGQRGVLLPIEKSGNASTLDIVSAVRSALPKIAGSLPKELRIRPLFDQSIFVKASIQGVIKEGVTAACLTALMILLFLGSWRSTVIIAVSIPLSILASLTVLSALGETINVMTLGGLALAVGILVDDATVTIENIERNLGMGKELRTAILDGAQEIAVPAFVSTLCISIVFLPMFLLQGVARYLFVPLAEAVMFAMLASYLLSRTLVPTLVMYLMKNHGHAEAEGGRLAFLRGIHLRFVQLFERFADWYQGVLEACLKRRRIFLPSFLGLCLLSLPLALVLGDNFFPDVDAGQIRLHVRTRTGMRLEETAMTVGLIEDRIRQLIPAADLEGVLDNIGLPTSGINLSYSNGGTIGPMDAEILISLKPEHRPTADYIRLLRARLPREFVGTGFFFQPADIVSQILNFGSPAPIDVQIVGNDLAGNAAVAAELAERMRNIPGTADVRVHQLFNQPRFTVAVDRTKSQLTGLTERDVANSVLVALSGSSQTSPNFWLNPKNGISYQITTQTPQSRIESLDALRTLPVTSPATSQPQLLENLSLLKRAAGPAVLSHYNVQPVVDVYANVQDRDLGAVAAEIDRQIGALNKKLPRGSSVVMRGQVSTMRSSFKGLGLGVIFAIVLVYLLIVINFQSWTSALIIIAALPGALAGICWMLFLTHTTLSVPALMGAIMSIGVATANSILMVSFANDRFLATGDALAAALEAGRTRLRPVIMTALAMVIGMIPMALGLGEGGEQNAPLGRAVIGGLSMATVATLFFVPAVFSFAHRKRPRPLGNTEQHPEHAHE